jgi:hypothetical protein
LVHINNEAQRKPPAIRIYIAWLDLGCKPQKENKKSCKVKLGYKKYTYRFK